MKIVLLWMACIFVGLTAGVMKIAWWKLAVIQALTICLVVLWFWANGIRVVFP